MKDSLKLLAAIVASLIIAALIGSTLVHHAQRARLGTATPSGPFLVDSYGAKSGSTAYAHQNTAAIQAAINAAMPAGGTVQFGPGTYFFDGPLVADGAKSLALVGVSPGVASGNAFGSSLNYTGSGSASALSFQSTQGCRIQDLKIGWSNTEPPGFSGILLDFRKGAGTDSALNSLERVWFFHQDGAMNAAAACLHVGGNFCFSASHCEFQGGQHCVIGRDAAAPANWSNTVHFDTCYFQGAHTSLIHNAYQAWTLTNCDLEPLDDGLTIGGITNDPALPALNLMMVGCWMGDGDLTGKAGGVWVHWAGPSYGLKILGGEIGINGAAKGVQIDGNNCKGISIDGVQWTDATAQADLDFGTTTGHSGVILVGVSKIGGTIPPQALIIP